MKDDNKYNLEAWKRYGGKKIKGTWGFGIDNKKYDVKGMWKRDKSGNVSFKPSLFGNKSMRKQFGESPRKTFKTIEENKRKQPILQGKLLQIREAIKALPGGGIYPGEGP
jgi:hypothetical protein|tara:strand:- start:48 stop:377 length:330 start_codon:yes stop_codon:yes gene_type:complete